MHNAAVFPQVRAIAYCGGQGIPFPHSEKGASKLCTNLLCSIPQQVAVTSAVRSGTGNVSRPSRSVQSLVSSQVGPGAHHEPKSNPTSALTQAAIGRCRRAMRHTLSLIHLQYERVGLRKHHRSASRFAWLTLRVLAPHWIRLCRTSILSDLPMQRKVHCLGVPCIVALSEVLRKHAITTV